MVKSNSNYKNVELVIGHLYARQMNVYGDTGNVLALDYRLRSRGFKVKRIVINSLQSNDLKCVDILIGGGGQDSSQDEVQADIAKGGEILKAMANDGLPVLAICGMYQLLGHRFVLQDGSSISGIGLIDMETIAGPDRLIGNIVIDSDFGRLVGFENHSGRTMLGSVNPLGRVVKGSGNNGSDETEGALYKNVFGTYMHGPALAKNPGLADEIIGRALEQKGIKMEMVKLDDSLELAAAYRASKRPV